MVLLSYMVLLSNMVLLSYMVFIWTGIFCRRTSKNAVTSFCVRESPNYRIVCVAVFVLTWRNKTVRLLMSESRKFVTLTDCSGYMDSRNHVIFKIHKPVSIFLKTGSFVQLYLNAIHLSTRSYTYACLKKLLYMFLLFNTVGLLSIIFVCNS